MFHWLLAGATLRGDGVVESGARTGKLWAAAECLGELRDGFASGSEKASHRSFASLIENCGARLRRQAESQSIETVEEGRNLRNPSVHLRA